MLAALTKGYGTVQLAGLLLLRYSNEGGKEGMKKALAIMKKLKATKQV
jgi:hypothetical protein